MKAKGFTLIELILVLAIIAILLAIFFGGDDANAAHKPQTVPEYLNSMDVHFMHSRRGDSSSLTIFDNGNAKWETAAEACDVLKNLDSSLSRVTLSTASDTNAESELVWNADHTELSNLTGRDEATCN